MVSSIQGLPPIIIQSFDEMQPDLSNHSAELNENFAKELAKRINQDEKKEKSTYKNGDEKHINKSPDFSELEDKLKSALNEKDLAIEFTLDKDTKKMIMRIVDSQTNEVIQQYPPDIALKIARIVASKLETGQVTNAKV